ncbi:MAG: hypothetical protein LBS55_08285, partial [Prevotellaceae bacterium]|nr:hypothetical protein [Prevotellaceae bacterium]
LRFLKEIEDNKYIEPAPELMENDYIRQAIEMCEVGAFNEAEKQAYERHWDAIRREGAALADSLEKGEKQGREKGRAEGKTEGIEIGRAEGIEIGKVEGIEIGKVEGIEIGEKRGIEKTVINSFKNGLSLEIISSITQLSNDEVISILKKHGLM